jgi:hypothetical protein
VKGCGRCETTSIIIIIIIKKEVRKKDEDLYFLREGEGCV